MDEMVNLLDALKWGVRGIDYNPEGPIERDLNDQIINRAKFEVWRYNTFGPGREVSGRDRAYAFVESEQMLQFPLYLTDPKSIAAMASVVAEINGHSYISFMVPAVMPKSNGKALEKITEQENRAVERASEYYGVFQGELKLYLSILKKRDDLRAGREKN